MNYLEAGVENCYGWYFTNVSDRFPQETHPRYQCHNHCEYITKFALPPYLLTQKQLTT